jgi:hypothetical protein
MEGMEAMTHNPRDSGYDRAEICHFRKGCHRHHSIRPDREMPERPLSDQGVDTKTYLYSFASLF